MKCNKKGEKIYEEGDAVMPLCYTSVSRERFVEDF